MKVFGLFQNNNILGIVTEEFFSKEYQEIKDICFNSISESDKNDIEVFSGYTDTFDSDNKLYEVYADNGIIDLEFKELNRLGE